MELKAFSRIADWYDIFVQVDFDIPFFLKETKKSGGQVLELMSGTGRVSVPLIQAGIQLTCVDISAEMLAVLQDKLAGHGLSANVVQMDVCALNLSKCFDLIIIPFHSFAEIVSQDGQRKALTRIGEHLSPTGRFICTLRNPAAAQPPDGKLRLFSRHPLPNGRGTLLFWLLQELNPTDKHIVDMLEFFEEYDAAGVLRSRRLVELAARLVSRAEFEELAASTGFRIVALYGDYAYADFREESSPFMLWELEKAENAR